MKWCVEFPEETILLVRPSLVSICLDIRPAAKLLHALLYRCSIKKEHNEDAANLNEVKTAKGEAPDQDTTMYVYRKQSQLVNDVIGELTEKTLHDVAVPALQLLGYLDIEESQKANCYIIHVDTVQNAIKAHSKNQLEKFLIDSFQLEKFLIDRQLEKVLINKKYFLSQLEKVLIANRKSSNCQRGRKVTLEEPSDGDFPKPQISNKIITKNSNKDIDTYEDVVANAKHQTLSPDSLQEMIASLQAIGFTITRDCADENNSHSHDARPFVSPPLQSGEIGTPLAASRVTMTPPTESVAITPRSQGEISPDHDRTGDTIQRSHYIATQNSAVLPPETSENSHDTLKPSNDTPVTSRGSQRENEASQPDTSEQAASYSQDKEPPLAAEKPKRPRRPAAEKPAKPTKPVISQEEMNLRTEIHAWIDQRRGYKLYGRATPKQVIEENTAVITLAHMVYLAQYENNVEDGGTWDELRFTWDTIEKSDRFWSKPENKGRIGAQAVLQMFAPTVQERRKKLQQREMQHMVAVGVGAVAVAHREESELERNNRLMSEKYGKRA